MKSSPPEPGARAAVPRLSKTVRTGVTVLATALALWLFARLFAHVGLRETWRALGAGGPFVVLALVPFAAGMTIDSLGTVAILRALGHKTTLAQMLPVRIASEALHISLPAGFVASDTASAMLLNSRCEVPVGDGIVTSIARKWLVMRSHAVYIGVGALAGMAPLAMISREIVHGDGLPWAVLASAGIPLAASYAIGNGLLGRSTFASLVALLAKVPSAGLRRWLEGRRRDAVATDAQVARLRAAKPWTRLASLAFLGGWCVEALESALLLRLVGAHVPLHAVFAFEGGLSLIRALQVVAPPGLGVIDLGYATLLPAFGADPGAAPAFVLLKRAKELAWVAVGYAILGATRSRAARVEHEAAVAQTAT